MFSCFYSSRRINPLSGIKLGIESGLRREILRYLEFDTKRPGNVPKNCRKTAENCLIMGFGHYGASRQAWRHPDSLRRVCARLRKAGRLPRRRANVAYTHALESSDLSN